MSARRDQEGRLPDGSGLVFAGIAALVFWGALALLLAVAMQGATSDQSVSTEEASHADQ